MIRREFLKNAAVLAGGLTAKISYGAPCSPQLSGAANVICVDSGESNLEQRTSALVSSNTPQLGVNYFRSEDGGQMQIANNRTSQQGSSITWQVQGIYYDPARRIMHQLDKQHNGSAEHAAYNELTNSWTKINASLLDAGSPSHWRQQAFIPQTGQIFYHKETEDFILIYDPNSGWRRSSNSPWDLAAGGSGPAGFGYHPNLFGPARPGMVVANVWRFYAWDIAADTWTQLNTSNMPSDDDLYDVDRGEGFYIPSRDELLMTARGKSNRNGQNVVYALAAGAGLETNLSTSNSAELRYAPAKQISAHSNNDKCYACIHPRQPNVLLAFDAASSSVQYTDDGATTPWKTAPFTSPFASELNTDGKYTVGCLPQHGVVAGAASASDNTRFVFWKPPLV